MADRKPTSREMADRQLHGMRMAVEYLRSKEETARARKRLEDAGFDVEKWLSLIVGGEGKS